MWIIRIIVVLLCVLTGFYYLTVILHIVTPIFKKANPKLIWIPFYCWIKGL